MKPLFIIIIGLILSQCKIIDDGDVLTVIEKRDVKNIKISGSESLFNGKYSYQYSNNQITSMKGENIEAQYLYKNVQLSEIKVTSNNQKYTISFQRSPLNDTLSCSIIGNTINDTVKYITSNSQTDKQSIVYSKSETKTSQHYDSKLMHILNSNGIEGLIGSSEGLRTETTLSNDISYINHQSGTSYHLHNLLFPNIYTSKDERIYTSLLKNHTQVGSIQSSYITLNLGY